MSNMDQLYEAALMMEKRVEQLVGEQSVALVVFTLLQSGT